MIMTSMYEDLESEEINLDELKKFLNTFEKEIKAENWEAVLKKIEETGYGSDKFKMVKAIFDTILDENILTRMKTIPSNFFRDDKIKTIDIPSNITAISNDAFRDCKELEAVNMADSVTAMGDSAFAGCTKLKDIKLSEKLEAIPNTAFNGCSALDHIFIPDNVKRLGYDVFKGCPDTMVVELNRGVNRAENENDPHQNALKMKSSTHEFVSKHLKWKNA